MIFIFLFLFAIQGQPVYAKPVRTVQMSEGDMAQVFVSPRFSTLIKFDAHPEPGLIGDQDAFKVEYMRNMVAIKPLVSRGKTNLFLFTKEGQFNFQLVAGTSNHDNIVYVRRAVAPSLAKNGNIEQVVIVDDLLTKKISKTATTMDMVLRLESIAAPISRSTIVLRFSVEQKFNENKKTEFVALNRDRILVTQYEKSLPIENTYLEHSTPRKNTLLTKGLILLRGDRLKRNANVDLRILPVGKNESSKSDLLISFSADFARQ